MQELQYIGVLKERQCFKSSSIAIIPIIKPTRCTHFSNLFWNKFEKLVHLVGFIIGIYHEVRSPEPQNCYNVSESFKSHSISGSFKSHRISRSFVPYSTSESFRNYFVSKVLQDQQYITPLQELHCIKSPSR